jgi:hypothetical protein
VNYGSEHNEHTRKNNEADSGMGLYTTICLLAHNRGRLFIGAGDNVRVDFDLSSEFPSPPYNNITAFYGFGAKRSAGPW